MENKYIFITNRTKILTKNCSCYFSFHSSSIPSLMSLDLSSLIAQQQKQQQPSTPQQQTLPTIPSPSQSLPINGQLFYDPTTGSISIKPNPAPPAQLQTEALQQLLTHIPPPPVQQPTQQLFTHLPPDVPYNAHSQRAPSRSYGQQYRNDRQQPPAKQRLTSSSSSASSAKGPLPKRLTILDVANAQYKIKGRIPADLPSLPTKLQDIRDDATYATTLLKFHTTQFPDTDLHPISISLSGHTAAEIISNPNVKV